MRIKSKDVREHRIKMYRAQKGICLLCKTKMTIGEAVLDHDHGTGHLRGVLHTSCNSSEGRIAKAIFRSRAGNKLKDLVDFVHNLKVYWSEDYSKNPLHFKHLIPEEKEIRRLKKYKSNLKTDVAKQRKQIEIDNLAKIIKHKIKEL